MSETNDVEPDTEIVQRDAQGNYYVIRKGEGVRVNPDGSQHTPPANGEPDDSFADARAKIAVLKMSDEDQAEFLLETLVPNARERAKLESATAEVPGNRTAVLVFASDIPMERKHWLWKNRIAIGCISLVVGRMGIGKSTLTYELVANVTTGRLRGEYEGIPKYVGVCATEDSWATTIRPRLTAAGADLTKVFHIKTKEHKGDVGDAMLLKFPDDFDLIESACDQVDMTLLVVDPLISRIGDADTYKSSDVRKVLEPLKEIAERRKFSVIGIMHPKKGAVGDPLEQIAGAFGFGEVARSVHTVVMDPDTPDRRMFGTVKNNDYDKFKLKTYAFTIKNSEVPLDDGEMISIGALEWLENSDESIFDAIIRENKHLKNAASGQKSGEKKVSRVEAAAGFLTDHFTKHGPTSRPEIIGLGAVKGHSESSLNRAIKTEGFSTKRGSGVGAAALWGITEQFTTDEGELT